MALLSPPTSFGHDFQDETWDHPPCRPAISAAAAELLSSKLTRRDGHSSAGRTNHCYVDIDNDVVISADDADAEICPDCAEIQAAVSDKRELDDDTAIDSSDVQSSRQTLAPPASRTPAVQSSRTLRAYLEANGCLDYSWRCVCA